MEKVILSTALLLGDGTYQMRTISQAEAQEWVNTHSPRNFVGHQTVKLLGLEPATDRAVCQGYDEALCLKPRGRMEFGREYTVSEISEIGVDFQLITKVG